jgi:phosphoribosylformimino-5-aminoimidazole carboxamide ribotide isomerase
VTPLLVIPAIDLKDGRCVRLRQGNMVAETVYSDDVASVAAKWQQAGATVIHVVDLNGAMDGEPRNLPQIEAVIKTVNVKVQIGGGIRNLDTLRRYLNAGVSRLVLGTDGNVAVKGWTAVSETKAIDLLKELSGYAIGAVIYTDISRDGMLSGPNLPALKEVVEYSSFPVVASGGITRVEDLKAVRALGPRIEGAIVGKALYDGKLDYQIAVAALRES